MRLIPLVLALAVLAIAGPAGTAHAETLEGRTFVSVNVEGEQIPGGGPLTVSFTGGQVSAYAGCNRGVGAADLTGGRLATRLATTMMACPPPFGDADAWMSRLFEARPAWTLTGDTLTLRTDATTVTLRDKRAVDPDRPLIGTTWRVHSLISPLSVMTSQALEQANAVVTFGADSSVTGSTGCNQFYGRADVSGNTIVFGPPNPSGPPCTGEAGDIEASILRALGGKATFSIDAAELQLKRADGYGLVLRAEA